MSHLTQVNATRLGCSCSASARGWANHMSTCIDVSTMLAAGSPASRLLTRPQRSDPTRSLLAALPVEDPLCRQLVAQRGVTLENAYSSFLRTDRDAAVASEKSPARREKRAISLVRSSAVEILRSIQEPHTQWGPDHRRTRVRCGRVQLISYNVNKLNGHTAVYKYGEIQNPDICGLVSKRDVGDPAVGIGHTIPPGSCRCRTAAAKPRGIDLCWVRRVGPQFPSIGVIRYCTCAWREARNVDRWRSP